MLEIVVKTENWERHVRVSAEELAGLVRRIGGDGDRFLVVQRIPWRPFEWCSRDLGVTPGHEAAIAQLSE